MNVGSIFLILDFAGIGFFAFSGGMLAARKSLDPFGAAILGAVAGMGGGTLRDVLLGELPVYWIVEPKYLWIALGGALLGYFLAPGAQWLATRRIVLIWADAIGLAVFCVLAGAAAFVAGMALGLDPSWVTIGSAVLAFVLRGCAIQFKWSLPAITLGD